MRRVGALCGSLSKQVHTQDKKEGDKDKALTSIRSWDDSSSEEEDHHKRCGHKYSSSITSRVCLIAQGNKKPIPSDSVNDSDSDDELPSYNEIVQEILNMLRFALANKRSLLCWKKN